MVLAVVALAGLALPACGDDGDRLTIDADAPKALLDPLLQRYTKATGQEVDVRYASSVTLARRLAEEGKETPADVVISQRAAALEQLGAAGRLAVLPTAVVGAVDARFRSARSDWVAFSARTRGLVHDVRRVPASALPHSVLDLVDPAFEGRVGLAPGNPSVLGFVDALRRAQGDGGALAWLVAMKRNGARAFGDEAAVVRAVQRGDVDFGLADDDEAARLLVDEPDADTALHQFAAGDAGNVMLLDAAGVVVGSDDEAAATLLVSHLLSPAGQAYASAEALEHPTVDGTPSLAGSPPLADATLAEEITPPVDLAAAIRLVEESGIASD
jgi:iron(III) transport system substrate-binding protein